MKAEILPLFRDVLLVCQEMDLLGGTFFALDGLKLPSNASKEWSDTRPELHRKKERLEAKVKELLAEHVQEDDRDDPPPGPGGGRDRERQVQRLQKQAERLEKWLQDNDPKYGTMGKEIAGNLTDNESAKMKTSHGVIQGYNSQALIDVKHQVIIHAEACGRGQDHAHGPPMLDGALENLKGMRHGEEYFAGKIFTGDTNYHNDTNLRKRQELRLLRSLGVTFLHFCTSKGFLLYKNIKKVDVTNLYRFLILSALIFALGCGSGPSSTTTPKSSSSSEFGKMCQAMGAEGGKLEREKFIAQAKGKEAAAKLFDSCDAQQKGYLTEDDVTPGHMDRLKGQAIRLSTPNP